MKHTVLVAGLVAAAVLALGSCATTDNVGTWVPDPRPAVVEELQEARTVVVLGYNSSIGLDDRTLDDRFSSGGFGLSISVEEDVNDRHPVGDRINGYEAEFMELLTELGPYEVVDKETLFAADSYARLPEVHADDPLSNVLVADGYRLTYEFNNFMDGTDSIPNEGEVVNNYAAILEEVGADLGIIVVEKPWVRVRTFALIPDQLINKMESYFAVAGSTTYFIILPRDINKELYSPTFLDQSDTRYLLKGYTAEQQEQDEVTFLDQYGAVSTSNHRRFVEWLAEAAR
jgi:hypothetical protein